MATKTELNAQKPAKKRRKSDRYNVVIKVFAIVGILHLIFDVVYLGIWAIQWIRDHVIIQ